MTDTVFEGETVSSTKPHLFENAVRPPHKRVKATETSASDRELPRFAKPSVVEPINNHQTTVPATKLPIQMLPSEIQHLQSKYDFITMSIISSSKIEQKVRNLLLHLEKFSITDTISKPGVVILHAKSSVASKLVSIVEIAKKNVEKDGGKWWQYSRLHGQITELKRKSSKQKKGGKTLLEWEQQQEHSGKVGEHASVLDDRVADSGKGGGDVPPEEEEETAFETMGQRTPSQQNAPSAGIEARNKIRAVPVMSIYMSRVPITELKALYGEQTNE
ncbi:hypothetical protein MMC24_003398 [Lignoscripta atroalba]|nr:hypothetical protein [Lignoscripta atroalba]